MFTGHAALVRLAKRLAAAVLATVAVAACGAGGGDVGGDTTRAAELTGQTPAWQIVNWEPYAGVEPTDLGVGVVFLEIAEDKGATLRTDSLVLRATPDVGARPVGAMVFSVDSIGATRYAVAALDSLRSNLVEYGYEESGIPFDSTDATGRWLRAILGYARDSVPLSGWVDRSEPGVGQLRWADHLADRPIYFRHAEGAAFFATADSTRALPVPRGDDDAYAIHPIAAHGPWLQVRVVEPSDNCEPDAKPRQTRTVWIRYLDDRGRPTVWYYPRGC